MNSPIKYYGGKSYMTDIIISHFPKDYSVYIEGFGGGASVIIENRNIFDLIEKYDNENVFFYLDPPYVHDTRSSGTEYECEMSDEEHENFLNMLLNGKGKFLISGYEHPIYRKLVDNGWNLYKYDSVNACSDRTECLWYNYDIEEGDLFNEI